MEKREYREYYLGLDMGTSSVGWAATDKQYNLIRAKGKDLWGIREFEEADTAAERRNHRVSRRRRQRDVARMGIIKDYFHDAISEKDPDFFQRLENSKYHIEDKNEAVRYKYGLFNDDNYSDIDYYKQYPTIFHLRKELINNENAPYDVRLIYLAIANLFKRRGHFLDKNLGEGSERSMDEAYSAFAAAVKEYADAIEATEDLQFPDDVKGKDIEAILGARDFSRTEKAEKLQVLFDASRKNKRKTALIKGICGLKVDAAVIFEDIEFEEKCSIDFTKADFDEAASNIEKAVGEENFQIVLLMKEMADIGTLSGIMKGYRYLSEARVATYEKHKLDLETVKSVLKEYNYSAYDLIFRENGPGSYSAYVNSTHSGGKKCRRNMKGRNADELYKAIRGAIKNIPENDKRVKYILQEIERDSLLPKQLTSSNGVIPNQVHKKELDAILDNAAEYLPFLNVKDESGLTVSERISRLFAFQIPYYVGPLSVKSKTGWVVRKKPGQVLPWNIEEKVDVRKTSEAFIENLIRECTYISGEKVLPKASLKYEKYCVLNELNNLRIDGEKISLDIKKDIYENLFKTGKKVARKRLASYLLTKGLISEEAQISGVDTAINSSLSSYGKFRAIFGDKIEDDRYIRMAEDIIFWCTIYGDEKKFLKQNLTEKYGDQLDADQIKKICGMKFRDWGRLSEEFLDLEGCYKPTGEMFTIIRALMEDEENRNLMELLNSDLYTFAEVLEEKTQKSKKLLSEFEFEDLQDTYFSAPVKRMIWQTIQIIKELEEVLGSAPARVFIEMTRSDEIKGDKGRKASRKNDLQRLYKNIKSESASWKKEMTTRIDEADTDGRLRSKKMYLYFSQMGRCMYTGEEINLDELFNKNLYDIDHIYPRHFVKDDSIINNLVLVRKEKNAHKKDIYPIEAEIRNSSKVAVLWKSLMNAGLISKEKYRRLTGSKAFTDEQKAGFIARQLVETGQGTKGVADILKQILPEETDIVYAKAKNVSDFRHEQNLIKSRAINDFHHAHDAYLNIVVGNVYYVKFTKNPLNFIRKEYRKDPNRYNYNLNKMFANDVVRGEETAWISSGDHKKGSIEIIKTTLKKNTPLMTRLSFTGHGGIADQTLYGAGKAKPESYIPLKSSDERMRDVTKYGGFSSASTAYFFLVEHGESEKRIRTLETVPVYKVSEIGDDETALLRYCIDELKLIEPSIRMKKIKIQSLIKRDGFFVNISGKTGKQIVLRNTVNLCLDIKWSNYIHGIEKYREAGIVNEALTTEKNIELYDILTNKHDKEIFARRPNPVGKTLLNGRTKFIELPIEEQLIVLSEVLALSRIGTTAADLTRIGGAGKSGVLIMSKNISKSKEFILINQSVTGIFENRIDLLKI